MRLPASGRHGRTSIGFVAVLTALCAGLALAQQPPAPDADAAAAPAKKATAKAAPAARSVSYSLGVSMGTQLKNSSVSPDAINPAALGQGVRDAMSGKTELNDTDKENITKLISSANTSAGETNHRAAAAFLAENAKKPGVVTTASGLQYKVLTPGSGAGPNPTDEVTVNYKGSLLNGTVFDSSEKHGGPAKFPLNRVIPGWSEGVGLMKPGAKYELWVPPHLAYDMRPQGDIPPGSLLVFEVELLSAKPVPAAAAAPMPTPTPTPAK